MSSTFEPVVPGDGIPIFNREVSRVEVPGGWIYVTTTVMTLHADTGDHEEFATSSVFVPDTECEHCHYHHGRHHITCAFNLAHE